MSLSEAARTGDRRKALVALRDQLAATIEGSESGRDIAALARQLTDVLGQIEGIDGAAPQQEGTALDELQRRRAARQANPKNRAAP